MTTRVLPEADRFATCPNDGKVLDYYAGVFASVYVVLSPFMAPLSDAFVAMCDSPDPEAGPDRIAIVAHCRPVPWCEVARESGLPDLAAVDIALRTQIGGLSAAFRNTDYAARLKRLYENDRLWPPIEGQHAELLQHTVLELFQALGHDWVLSAAAVCVLLGREEQAKQFMTIAKESAPHENAVRWLEIRENAMWANAAKR